MAKLKNPLMSFDASRSVARAITYVTRRKQHIAEKKPELKDVKSPAQLNWRHMYLKAVALWNALSAVEKQEWESLARPKHMTGFAWFMSQCLRPNPGIYLPLQGGTMQGDIDMAKFRLLKLPLPTDSQEPLTLAYYTANIAPFLYNEGCRAYHDALQDIPDVTWTTLALNQERYDTDSIHDLVVNNSRLTCKTAGKYVISAMVAWHPNAAGTRVSSIMLNGTTSIAETQVQASSFGFTSPAVTTQYHLAVNDYVEIWVYQSSGAPLFVRVNTNWSPEFAMQRIGL